MNDLDRRIAIEVFGEKEPPPSTEHVKEGITVHSLVLAQNWKPCEIWTKDMDFVRYGWQPAPFSSVLEEALRAADKLLAELSEKTGMDLGLSMIYEPNAPEPFHTYHHFRHGYGQTLPEAICNLLLALKEKK